MFPSTRQTLVRQASSAAGGCQEALNAVLEIYWQPCYRYVLLRFHAAHEQAQDLVQGFFTALVEQEMLARYDAARGPFRPYLRACLDQFVFKEFERSRCEKRGGRATHVPLDQEDVVPAGGGNPEEIFHREWQRQIFALALEDLRAYSEQTERAVRYRIFAAYDMCDEPRPSYGQLAAAHGIPVTAVTNHLAWARRELRRLLEKRLGMTTASEGERLRELRSLLHTTAR